MATHSSILAWEIQWTEEPCRLYSPWGHKSQVQLRDYTTKPQIFFFFKSKFCSFLHIHLIHILLDSYLSISFFFFLVLIYKTTIIEMFSSVSSVAQSCPTCNPMNCSTPGLPVHHQLPEFTQNSRPSSR